MWQLNVTTIPLGKTYDYYPHFTEEETKAEHGQYAKVTQLVCGKVVLKLRLSDESPWLNRSKELVIKGQGPEEMQLKVKWRHYNLFTYASILAGQRLRHPQGMDPEMLVSAQMPPRAFHGAVKSNWKFWVFLQGCNDSIKTTLHYDTDTPKDTALWYS